MRRATRSPVDLGVYLRAVLLLLRNPSIVVVPLLMAVIGILIGMVMTPGGGAGGGLIGSVTSGLGGFVVILLELFGLGTACIIADDAWRYGRASFDKGWTEARRRAGEILFAALGVTLLFAVGQYAGALLGFAIGPVPLGLVLIALIALFLIWAIPAAATGGMRGGEAIQVSVDRVRANPLAAGIATAVTIALVMFAAPYAGLHIVIALAPYIGVSTFVYLLIDALMQAIALGYVALVLTKTYADAGIARRW